MFAIYAVYTCLRPALVVGQQCMQDICIIAYAYLNVITSYQNPAPPIDAHLFLQSFILIRSEMKESLAGLSRGGGEGRNFPGPRDIWGPPSFENTEKCVPDGFLLTSNMHKIHFRPGLCPRPCWGSFGIFGAYGIRS